MKKSQLLDARRNIRKEFVAFFSIIMISLMAAMAYLGIAYTAGALKQDAVSYFNAQEFWDADITSTMLMTDEDLDAVRAVQGVHEVERVWQVDTTLRIGGDNTAVSVISLPEHISVPVVLAGRLPETAKECAIEKELADECGLEVGQQLHIDCDAIMDADPLTENDLVITGVFYTPDHFSYMVPVTPYIIVTQDCFNKEGLDGAFMKARIRIEGAPENRYSDAYWDVVNPVIDALETLGDERALARTESIRSGIEDTIREGRQEVDKAREELRRGQDELDQAREELDAAKEQLEDAKEQLRLAREKQEELAQLGAAGTGLPTGGTGLAGMTGTELPGGVTNLPGTDGTGLPAEAPEQPEIDESKIEDMEREIEDGEQEITDAERELAEGEKTLQEAEARLEEAREKLDAVGECRWVVLNGNGNPGFVYGAANSDKLASLSMSFSTIFLIVGALVIYATISRMVEQQRRLIGVNKALGVYNREIFAKYLIFACGAVALGVGVGVALAWGPMQRAVLHSYEAHLNYGEGARCFLPVDTVLVVAGALAISLITVYLGCSNLLRNTALALMQGASPNSIGRKTTRSSAKKSLFFRLILRNMVTDRTRVLVTIASIAGGCVLMVVGFTLRYGISGVPDRQFGGIVTYDAEVFYDVGENADAASELEDILNQNALQHISVSKVSSIFEADEKLNALTIIVAEKGDLQGYFALQDVACGEATDVPDSGALVPRRFWEYYGIDVGRTVPVIDSGMKRYALPIAGVFENYYGQIFFMTPQGYAETFGAAPERNCFFVKTGDMPIDVLQSRLESVEGFVRIVDAAADRTMIEQFTSSLNFVVYLMLFIAGVMACFIVANFTVTFIQRKTGELTIMRINGFTSSECIRYLAADLVLTTVLGTAVGLVIGGLMGSRILGVTETPYIQMVREPRLESFLFSALITFGFSILTNGVVLRRIHKLKLTDIN